jgi:D-alanine-D-alanine ligase
MVKDFQRWFSSRRIGVLMGGTSAERSISIKTGQAIYRSLKRQSYQVVSIDAKASLPEALRKNKITYAYIALHGTGGEDGRVQGLLEWMKIPYSGSGVLASALAMDKVACKRFFEAEKLPTAPWYSLHKPRPLTASEMAQHRHPSSCKGGMTCRLDFPVVVKPASQGSAVGISIVRHASQWPKALMAAFRYDDVVVVEKFLEGPEVTVGILGAEALPIIEILPQHHRPFYDFHAKYARGGSRHILPARISAQAARRCEELSLAACRILGTRGAARVDLIIDRRRGPCLLEVNTIPGMTETSLLPEAARAAGIDFDALVLRIAETSVAA